MIKLIISIISDIANVPLDYRNSVELDFATGDQLMFVGYATGSENDTVYASPTYDQAHYLHFLCKTKHRHLQSVEFITHARVQLD